MARFQCLVICAGFAAFMSAAAGNCEGRDAACDDQVLMQMGGMVNASWQKKRLYRRRNKRGRHSGLPGITGKTALIVADMQNDFIIGTLPVPNAAQIIPVVNAIANLPFDLVTYTQDYHPTNHISFASNSPLGTAEFEFETQSYTETFKICGQDYVSLFGGSAAGNCAPNDIFVTFQQQVFPDHCIQNSVGQQLHEEVEVPDDALLLYKGYTDTVDSLGVFFNNIGENLPANTDPLTLKKTSETGLNEILKGRGIKNVVLVGLAEDFVVLRSGLQSLELGYHTYMVTDATKPVAPSGGAAARQEFQSKGGKLILSCALLGTCPS